MTTAVFFALEGTLLVREGDGEDDESDDEEDDGEESEADDWHVPDGAPFELARERVTAEEYVMVGDDYEVDVEGARAAGFVPVHYEREGPNFWETLLALV